MGVPFEALIPYGIIIGMFGITSAGLSILKSYQNDGKKARWNLDAWDRYVIVVAVVFSPRTNEANRVNSTVMERDLRITGRLRGQSGNPEPPKGFEVSNPWRIEKRIF
ncbi:hypothetical protein M432DRAFT_642256 [Thermoascus aurantiacus ATCC 26904]